jgi:hypothetical protein
MAGNVEKKEGTAKAVPSNKKVKVKALIHLSGKFALAWSPGQEFVCDEKQAKELIELKAVELVK